MESGIVFFFFFLFRKRIGWRTHEITRIDRSFKLFFPLKGRRKMCEIGFLGNKEKLFFFKNEELRLNL